jgi:hypothetical protein
MANRHGVLKRGPAEKVNVKNLFCLKSRSDKFTDFSERPRSGSLKNAAGSFLCLLSFAGKESKCRQHKTMK